jgi:hypothetical protein
MDSPIPNKFQPSPSRFQLHQRLLALPFDAYLKLVSLALTRLGYQDIALAGRTDWKGHNRAGGFDLIATLPGGLHPRRVVIQAKQFDAASRIFQRQADELRGVAIRAGATEALLVTSGPISRAIDRTALEFPLAPVRLIGGDDLLSLLIRFQIGVLPGGELDEDLFRRLESAATGNRPGDCSGSTELLLTVSLRRVPKRQV